MVSSIIEAVSVYARKNPDRVAIRFEGDDIRYGRLYAAANRYARTLSWLGVNRGDRVGIYLDNSPVFAAVYLGIHLAGGVVVLINSQYRETELRHILTDSGARFCITSQEHARFVDELGIYYHFKPEDDLYDTEMPENEMPYALVPNDLCADLDQVAFANSLEPAVDGFFVTFTLPDGDWPATIGYTSGTTGRAKGALMLHRNHIANITAITTAWHWTPDDRLLLALPLFHTHGLMVGLHGALFLGGSVDLRRKFDAAETLAAFAADPDISLFFGVPTMYGRLVAEAEVNGVPDYLPKLFVSGSAPLSPHLFGEFERLFGQRILERYGMTETGMNLTNPYDGERRPGTVGGPFPGQEARIVDMQTRATLGSHETGEIEIRGPHVFSGYINRPEATAESFSADGWFRTGDLGEVSADGYFTITGRAKELIISGGYNVYPREVEDALISHPAVAEVAVIGAPDSDLGEQVVAAVVRAPDADMTAEDLIAHCRERLASYKKPRRVIFVESLPRNALGKVQKHLLAEQVWPQI